MASWRFYTRAAEDRQRWGKQFILPIKYFKSASDSYFHSFNKKQFDGLTGAIYFDSYGRRKNYTIGIYKVELNSPLSKASRKFFQQKFKLILINYLSNNIHNDRLSLLKNFQKIGHFSSDNGLNLNKKNILKDNRASSEQSKTKKKIVISVRVRKLNL